MKHLLKIKGLRREKKPLGIIVRRRRARNEFYALLFQELGAENLSQRAVCKRGWGKGGVLGGQQCGDISLQWLDIPRRFPPSHYHSD